MDQSSFFCPQCNQMKLFQRPVMSHTPHILASVFLCGLWLPIWLMIAATYNPPWRCSNCGYSDAVAYLVDPGRRQRERIYVSQQAEANAARQRQLLIKRAERDESAFQTFIREHRTLLIAGGVGAGVLGAIILSIAVSRPTPVVRSPSTTTAPAVDTLMEAGRTTRRELVSSMRVELMPRMQDIQLSQSGTYGETLTITSKAINEKWVHEFKRSLHLKNAKQRNFKSIHFSNGKNEWTINP